VLKKQSIYRARSEGSPDVGTYLVNNNVTPQVRHPERVFLREGSPGSGTVFNMVRTRS